MSEGLKNIINESSNLLIRQGYHNTSMANIGNSCNLNKGSIYHYFSSKEDLVRAVLGSLREKFITDVFSCAYQDNKPEKKRLVEMIKQTEKYFISSNGCLMWQLGTELAESNRELKKVIIEFFDFWIAALYNLFKTQFTKKKALELAIDSIIQIEGAVIWLRIKNDYAPLKRVFLDLKLLLD